MSIESFSYIEEIRDLPPEFLDAPLKLCGKCGVSKPATLTFFYNRGRYLQSACKECQKLRMVAVRKLGPEKRQYRIKHIPEVDATLRYFRQQYEYVSRKYIQTAKQVQALALVKENLEKAIGELLK